jgi:putative heme iron utilization protein
MEEQKKDVILETTEDAIRMGKTLLRTARSASIATLDPESGRPVCTRVGMSTMIDGTPTILISAMTAHAKGLRHDPRCSLLIGEPGRGDPLAHARMTVQCTGVEIERGSPEEEGIASRYLAHSPKAKLYVGLGDFRFFRLDVESVSLNGGFGRAYNLKRDEILSLGSVNADLAAMESGAVEHMNEDHFEAVSLYARHYCKAPDGNWKMLGLDADGIDLANGDDLRRVFFPQPIREMADMRGLLVRMATEARQALGEVAA